MKTRNIAIVGTVGIPGLYGGFETLVENLAIYHSKKNRKEGLAVYCSSKVYPAKTKYFLKTRLFYLPLSANGIQSILYDYVSLVLAVIHKHDVILLLGVSGATFLPFIRMFSSALIVTNIDGIEWKREKWNKFGKLFLRFSELIATKCSHVLISDNEAIRSYVFREYNCDSEVIAYGGDHAIDVEASKENLPNLPKNYAFKVCRIEPENNIQLVLEAFASSPEIEITLVIVGNWDASSFGRDIYAEYYQSKNIILLDPIYDLGLLKTLRENASWYVHGHSAGGTNPSLVEAMHFGIPIVAYDCEFNRQTTYNQAIYFDSAISLIETLKSMDAHDRGLLGSAMRKIARDRYTWDRIGNQYFDIVSNC